MSRLVQRGCFIGHIYFPAMRLLYLNVKYFKIFCAYINTDVAFFMWLQICLQYMESMQFIEMAT